jgi:hypothetical protein
MEIGKELRDLVVVPTDLLEKAGFPVKGFGDGGAVGLIVIDRPQAFDNDLPTGRKLFISG